MASMGVLGGQRLVELVDVIMAEVSIDKALTQSVGTLVSVPRMVKEGCVMVGSG